MLVFSSRVVHTGAEELDERFGEYVIGGDHTDTLPIKVKLKNRLVRSYMRDKLYTNTSGAYTVVGIYVGTHARRIGSDSA